MRIEMNGYLNGDLVGVSHVHGPACPYRMKPADWQAMVSSWPFVRAGLKTIKAKDRRSGNWTTEHVRAMLEMGYKGQGTCELWMIYAHNDEPVGFVVTSVGPDVHLGVPLGLFIWITYLEPRHHASFDMALGELEQIAKARGLRYVEGMSSRAGWGRKLQRRGFDTHMTLYRKNVWAEDSE